MHISNYPLTILLHKYGHPYLTYLPRNFLSKLFFLKKYGSEIPYLPTIWTYVQNFVDTLLLTPVHQFVCLSGGRPLT